MQWLKCNWEMRRMKNVDHMNDFELSDYIDVLEGQKTVKSKELLKINKEFRGIDDELQKAISLRNNRNIQKRYEQKLKI